TYFIQGLHVEIGNLHVEIADLKNLTRRLSDHYLDLELLDQQARDVLGYVRTDELVIQ
ncbi:MAG: septum formation initiator family protein, partial [Paracoccaceae bacterium]|nr:septum formation initiator family protein [Paracoccaceae bacterium]